jgi:hypothetical protein
MSRTLGRSCSLNGERVCNLEMDDVQPGKKLGGAVQFGKSCVRVTRNAWNQCRKPQYLGVQDDLNNHQKERVVRQVVTP